MSAPSTDDPLSALLQDATVLTLLGKALLPADVDGPVGPKKASWLDYKFYFPAFSALEPVIITATDPWAVPWGGRERRLGL